MSLRARRKARCVLTGLSFFLLGMANVSGQDQDSRDRVELTVSALGEYEGFLYFERNPDLNGRNALRFVPDAELDLSGTAKLEGAVELRKDFADPSRSRVFLQKGFLDLDFDSWDLRVGRQIITAGRTDILRPTDSFLRRDYTDFIDPNEEPTDAVKVDDYLGDWTLTGIWAPIFRPDIFPYDPRNRWIGPTLSWIPGATPTQSLIVDVDRSSEPPKDLRSSQLGFRVTRRSGGVDWSGSYYWGYDRLPTYLGLVPGEPKSDHAAGATPVVVTPFYERIQVAGVDGETFVGPWGFRGEAAYTFTSAARAENPRIDDPYLRLVVGCNRTFSRIFSHHDLYMNWQFLMDSELPRRGAKNQDLVSVRLRHFFAYAITGELEYRFSPFRVLRSQAFLNLQDGDYVVQLEFRWQPRDAVSWTFGSDLMGGPSGSFFGLYGRNDRLRVALDVYLPRWQAVKPSDERGSSRVVSPGQRP